MASRAQLSNNLSVSAAGLDLSKPSLKTAMYFAQRAALDSMIAADRNETNDADTEALKKELARLLHHVDYSKGGLLGGDDAQRAQVARHWKITGYVDQFAWSAGSWPVTEQVAA